MGLYYSSQPEQPPLPTVAEVKTVIMLLNKRIKLTINKKKHIIEQKKKSIIDKLKESNINGARMFLVSMLNEEHQIDAMLLLQTIADLVENKIPLILSSETCPNELKAELNTLIYASRRLNLEELNTFREMISIKYGKEFIVNSETNKDGLVNKTCELLNQYQPNETYVNLKLKMLIKDEKLQLDYPLDEGYDLMPFQQIINNSENYNPYESIFYSNDVLQNVNNNLHATIHCPEKDIVLESGFVIIDGKLDEDITEKEPVEKKIPAVQEI